MPFFPLLLFCIFILSCVAIGAAFGFIVVVLFSIRQSVAGLTKTMADAEGVMKTFSMGAGDMLKEVMQEAVATKAVMQDLRTQPGLGVPSEVRDVFRRPRQPDLPEEEEAGTVDPDAFSSWANQ